MHWAWRVTIAVGIAKIVLLIILPMFARDWTKPATSLDSFLGSEFGLWLCLFLPCVLSAVATYALLTREFSPAGRRAGETLCRRCGYILRGISEPRFPECGERI